MKTVSVHEAKTHLSRLLESVAAGDEVIILKNGQPVARLTSIKTEKPTVLLGGDRGSVQLAADFDQVPKDFKPYIK